MSKRTIIIGVIAVAAFIAAMASLYFEMRKQVDEAERLFSDEDIPPMKIVKPKTVKTVTPEQTAEIIDLNTEENGIK